MSRRRRPPAAPPRNPFDPLDGRVDSVLDLHGATSIDVQARLQSFLETAKRRTPGGLVHIITGKGRNSAAGPVVKPAVKRLLVGELGRFVSAWARDDDDGGFLIRLKL